MRDKKDLTLGNLIVLAVVALLPLAIMLPYKFILQIQLEQSLVGKLKQVADANNIELASSKLSECVEYLETNKMTSGSTHIIYPTPTNDVGFFYNNLNSALNDLKNFPKLASNATSQDKADYNLSMSNQLIKLRETILDADSHVTGPEYLAYYPNQFLIIGLNALAVIWIFCVMVFAFFKYDIQQA